MQGAEKINELRTGLKTLRPYFSKAFLFALVASLLVLAPTFYMFEVYDRVVNSRNATTLLMLTLLVLFAYAVMEVLDWARSETMREAGVTWDNGMAPRVFDAIYSHNLKQPGGTTIQPMHDYRTLRDFLTNPVLGAVMESPISLVFLAVIFAINPLLFWFALTGALIQVAIAWFNERSTHPPLIEANRWAIAAQQYVDNTLRNAEVIASMGMQSNIHSVWRTKQQEFLTLQAQASETAGLFQAGSKFVQTSMSSLLLGLGAWLVLENALPGGPGTMIVGSVLGGRVLSPLVQIIGQWRAIVNARGAWDRLNQLLSQYPSKAASLPLPAPQGQITVEHLVAPAPGGSAPILKGLSFALQSGEVLAVIGPSASGKTTLARLLLGLWPASSGKVRLDGADIFNWDKLELGRHLGYLPQGVELLEGTVAENIARFGQADHELLTSAAKAAGLHEIILSLPKGYDSPIGPDGTTLSGGQRQRLGLARAIYGNPSFVVLDEPNSNLDEAGDAALLASIRNLKGRGTTFVVITHRTSIMAVTDKVLILRDGAQQAFGARDEVLATLQKPRTTPANSSTNSTTLGHLGAKV